MDVDVGAAAHRAPARPPPRLEQPVVAAEPRHRGSRHAQHLLGRARPDAAEQRQQVPVAKALREAMSGEEVADRSSCAVDRRGCAPAPVACRLKRGISPSMFQNARRARFAGWAKTPARPALLHSSPAVGTWTENDHLRGRRRHAELGEQGDKPRRSAFVENGKADVDAVRAAGEGDVDRVGVAAETIARFEQRHAAWPDRPRAAASPAIPEPITAIRFIGAGRSARCCRGGRSTGVRRRMSPSAPGGTREGGGRRRTPRGFQPAGPAGSATKTGSSCRRCPRPEGSGAAAPHFRHVELL